MIDDLISRPVIPAQKDTEPATEEQIKSYLELLPGWQIKEREGIPRLEKSYQFKNFQKALDFANFVGAIAEEADHHPAILITWGRTAVSWWTHVINGLHDNDFIMAAKTEKLFQEQAQ
jgi:4a-hydroxytetrahydrobiopterin dehydratase